MTVHSWRLVYTFLISERLNTFEHAIQGKVTANSIVNVKGWPLRVRNVCTRVHECKVKEVLHDESNSHSSCFDTTSTTTTTTTADSNNLTSENSKFFKKSFYWSNHPYFIKIKMHITFTLKRLGRPAVAYCTWNAANLMYTTMSATHQELTYLT